MEIKKNQKSEKEATENKKFNDSLLMNRPDTGFRGVDPEYYSTGPLTF